MEKTVNPKRKVEWPDMINRNERTVGTVSTFERKTIEIAVEIDPGLVPYDEMAEYVLVVNGKRTRTYRNAFIAMRAGMVTHNDR